MQSAEYETAELLPAFRQGLGEIGYVEGQNVRIEYRWAEFQYERLAPMAADLVRHSVRLPRSAALRRQSGPEAVRSYLQFWPQYRDLSLPTNGMRLVG